MLLDWNDPVLDIDRVECECKKADVVLCLGTSLRIDPVGSLPLLAQKFVIVNLQATPHDESAALIIRGLVDDVMHRLLLGLGYSDDWEDTAANSATIERVWKPTDVESVKAFQEVVHDADERRESMKRTSSKRRKKEREPNT
jgi:mono-ADP-ribosyltransferase sirtuin 6